MPGAITSPLICTTTSEVTCGEEAGRVATCCTTRRGGSGRRATSRPTLTSTAPRMPAANRARWPTTHTRTPRPHVAAANSRIKDVDVAEESTRFARYNILVQAGTAMLAQANAAPTSALRLLQ